MAFWKKSIELPESFYKAAGESVLDMAETQFLASDLGPRLRFTDALVILGNTKLGLLGSIRLLEQYPLAPTSDLEARRLILERCLQTSLRFEEAIGKLPLVDQSQLICQYPDPIIDMDPGEFERRIFVVAEEFSIQGTWLMKDMAKGANISSSKFIDNAAIGVKETNRASTLIKRAMA